MKHRYMELGVSDMLRIRCSIRCGISEAFPDKMVPLTHLHCCEVEQQQMTAKQNQLTIPESQRFSIQHDCKKQHLQPIQNKQSSLSTEPPRRAEFTERQPEHRSSRGAGIIRRQSEHRASKESRDHWEAAWAQSFLTNLLMELNVKLKSTKSILA